MAGAEQAVRRSRRYAGVIGGSAIARRTGPAGVADALAALAGAVIRAEYALISVAGEVVAFAEMSRYHLVRILSLLALALAASARATTRTIHEGSIVRSARLKVLVETGQLLVRAAFAAFAEETVVALAHAALERAHAVALGRLFLVHVALALALAVTQHFQIHRERLIDADLVEKNYIYGQ